MNGADVEVAKLAETERINAITEFTEVHGKDYADTILATNPSMETIKVLTAGKKAALSTNVGSNHNYEPPEKVNSGVKFRPDPNTGKLEVK